MADERAQVLYKKNRMLEKENQCPKNEIKNQQTVIEILITNGKLVDEWKTVKTKSKNNTNIASLSSVSQKTPSPVNFQNWFHNLIVIKVSKIEIHESQDHTPTNHRKHCEITNNKSKSRAEKIIHTAFVHVMQ